MPSTGYIVLYAIYLVIPSRLICIHFSPTESLIVANYGKYHSEKLQVSKTFPSAYDYCLSEYWTDRSSGETEIPLEILAILQVE